MAQRPLTLEQAHNWYHNASNLEKAGVRIRLFNCLHAIPIEQRFIAAVQDEMRGTPLP